jgi:hypothetical protein
VVVAPRRRRRWLAVVALALVLAVVAAAAVVWRLRPDLLAQIGIGTPTSSPTSPTPYVRSATPGWLPAGWTKVVDDEQRPSVVEGPATNGGTCTYNGPAVHVVRTEFDVSGCQAAQFVKDIVVRDGAVEAELSVTAGCGGLWIRTGSKGYFVMVCADRTLEVHKLADAAPGPDSRLSQSRPTFDPLKVVVGLLAQGSKLTVYVDGRSQSTANDSSVIASGRVGMGGFAPHPGNKLDATITRFRAWSADPTGT